MTRPGPSEITGVILAGGLSRRMGRDKALLSYGGVRFIEVVYRNLATLFPEMLVIARRPGEYPFLPCRQVTDLVVGGGVLAGIQSGLTHARTPAIFVVACDMPFLNRELIRTLCVGYEGYDVVMPESASGHEPLHALYQRTCLPAIETAIRRGDRRVVSFFPQVRVRTVPPEEIAVVDPGFASFRNINTLEEYDELHAPSDCRRSRCSSSQEKASRARGPTMMPVRP